MKKERLIDRLTDDVNEISPLFDICEFHGFIPTVTYYDGNLLGVSENCCCVALENSTPAGEDWIVTFWFDGTARRFKRAIEQYAIYFDIDEEVSLYVANRGQYGIPSSIEVLLEDTKWKMREPHDLAEDLNNKQKPKKTTSTTTKDYIICSNDDVESFQEPHSWLLDGVTSECSLYLQYEKTHCEWIKYDYRTICPKYHDADSPYWRIPVDMNKLKYCPYCGKKIIIVTE